jgi:hypothetical protein
MYKYKVFNPKMRGLEDILTTEPMEADWLFIKVVPVTEYEWVAVFQKTGELAEGGSNGLKKENKRNMGNGC